MIAVKDAIQLANDEPQTFTLQFRVINTTTSTEFIDHSGASLTDAVAHYESIEHGRLESVLTKIHNRK